MKLTAKEKELILQKRKEEDLEKPKFTAKLAHDLYELNTSFLKELCVKYEYAHLTKNDINCLFKTKSIYKKILSQGDSFDGFIDSEEGYIAWYDNINGAIEAADSSWAERHLINIKPIRSRKNSK